MYPVHPTDHLALTRAHAEAAIEAGRRRRKAHAQNQLRRDEDRLHRAWNQLSEALAAAADSQQRWSRIRSQ